MKKYTFLLLSLVFSLSTFAQDEETKTFEAIDYKQLERQFRDEAFQNNYMELFQRYQEGDSTLNLEDKRLIYFGSTFQDFYNPYYANEKLTELSQLVHKEELSTQDGEKILQISLEILSENPFESNALFALASYYQQTDKQSQSDVYLNRLMTIFDAIFSTGTGLSTKEPLYITQISHEYEVLGILNLPYTGEQSVVAGCDYLKVNNEEIEGMYFEITAPFMFMTEQFSN